jgi:hypothetical protein
VEKSVGVYLQRFTVGLGSFDTGAEEGFAYLFAFASGDAERYLAFMVVEGVAQEASGSVQDANDVTHLSLRSLDIAAVDPGVPRSRPIGAPLRQHRYLRRFRHGLFFVVLV